MGKQKEIKQARKKTQKIIFNKLAVALAEFRGSVKEKKMNNNLKRFSRSLAEDITKAEKKKNKTPEVKVRVHRKKELVPNDDNQQQAV